VKFGIKSNSFTKAGHLSFIRRNPIIEKMIPKTTLMRIEVFQSTSLIP